VFGLLYNNNNNDNHNNESIPIDNTIATTDDFVPYKFLVPLSTDTLTSTPTTTLVVSSSDISPRSSSPLRSALDSLQRLTMLSNKPMTLSSPTVANNSSTSATVDVYKGSLFGSSPLVINSLSKSIPVNDLEGTVTSSTTTDDDTHPSNIKGWSSSLMSSVSASAQARFTSPLRSSLIGKFNRLTAQSIANRTTVQLDSTTTSTTTGFGIQSSAIDTDELVPYKFLVPSSSSSSSLTANELPSQSTTQQQHQQLKSPTTSIRRLGFFLGSPTKSVDTQAQVPASMMISTPSSSYTNNYINSSTIDNQYTTLQQSLLVEEKHVMSPLQSAWTSWPSLVRPHTDAASPSSSSSSSSFTSPLTRRSKGRLIKNTIITVDEETAHETDNGKYEEMRGQIDSLVDTIEKLGQKMNTQLQSKSDEIEQMKEKLTAANSNADQLSSNNSQLQQQCAYAYNEYRNLEQYAMRLNQEREMLMVEVQQANQMVDQKQASEYELTQQIQNMSNQCEQLRSQCQQSIRDLTSKNNECNSRIEQMSVEYNALMLENMNLKKQNTELSKLVPTLESKVENLQFSNRQLQSAQEELSAKYQQQLLSTGSKIAIGFQQHDQFNG